MLGMEQASFAVSLVLAGSVLVLLLGTQLLNWSWLLALAVIGSGIAAYRFRKRIPTPYSTAQCLDQQLELRDTISTAWYLQNNLSLANTNAGQWQLAYAETVSRQVNASSVFPLRFQRSWAVAFALAGAAFALFAFRYMVRRDLDLRPSLAPIHLERLAAAVQARLNSVSHPDKTSSLLKAEMEAGRLAPTNTRTDRMSEAAGVQNPLEASNRTQPEQGSGSSSQNSKSGGTSPNSDQKNSTNKSMASTGSAAQKASDNADPAKNGEQGSRSQTSNGSQNDSLMSRMKDAMSSLLAKTTPEEPSQSAQQSPAKNAAAPDQDPTQSESGKSQNQKGASQSPNNAKADARSNEQGQATEMAQTAQNQNGGSSERKGGNQSKSGAGKQDGGKDLKNTAEQEAMGKLAEIIGKRSAQVSGEMTVEVPSGKQQLKTAYTDQVAQHSDTGGEINRDEVPLIFQDYVREYMERVHRQPPAK